MSILGFFSFIILIVIMGLYSIILIEKEYYSISIVLFIIAAICLSFMFADIVDTPPTALDVYKGNTELKITYEGKVPVDTVVIYKKKAHETE